MAPFGFHRPNWAKKKSKSAPAEVYLHEDPYEGNHAYTLSGGDPQYMHTTTQVPTKTNRWKTVLKRKPPPPVVETLTPLHDQRFEEHSHSEEYYNHQGTLPPIAQETTGHYVQNVQQDPSVRRVDSRVDSGSTSTSRSSSHRRAHSEHSGLTRHETGRSRAVTILPHDSASNIHVYPQQQQQQLYQQQQQQQPQFVQPAQYVQSQHGAPLHGIVEEQSDLSYTAAGEPHVHRPISPVVTPINHTMTVGPSGSLHHQETGGSFAVQHDIGRGLHLHHSDKHHGQRGMMPFQVTDAHGNKQDIQEITLDGSGLQEIPMPSHGNVIFIVEEGVTLDVKDPETGEYVPLEQYYANLAARRPPQQDQFVVVNGDASNVIVEDVNGNILHRGSSVKEEYIHSRSHSRSRSHSDRSEDRTYERSHRTGSVRSGGHNHVTVGSGKTKHIKVTNPNPNPEIRVYRQELVTPKGMKQSMDHWVIDVPSEHQIQTPAVHVYSPMGSMRPPHIEGTATPTSVQGSMLRPHPSGASSIQSAASPQGSKHSQLSRASSLNGPRTSTQYSTISRSPSGASARYSTRSGVQTASIRTHEHAPPVEIRAEPGTNVRVSTSHEGDARLEHGMGSPVTVHVTGTPRSHQIDMASVHSRHPSVRSIARSTATRDVVEVPTEEEFRAGSPARSSIRVDPSPRSILKGRATPAKSIKSIRGSFSSKNSHGNHDAGSIHNALLVNTQPMEIAAHSAQVEITPGLSEKALLMQEGDAMESFKLPEGSSSPAATSVYMAPASPLGRPGSFKSGRSVRSSMRRVGFEPSEAEPMPVAERSPSVRSIAPSHRSNSTDRRASAEQLLSLVVPSAEPGTAPVAEEPIMIAQSPAARSMRSMRAPSYRENVLSAVDEGGESQLGFSSMPSPHPTGEVNLASPMQSPMAQQFSRPVSPYSLHSHHEHTQAFVLDPGEPAGDAGFAYHEEPGFEMPGGMPMASPARSKAPSVAPSIRSNHSQHVAEEWGITSPARSRAPSMAPSIGSNHSQHVEHPAEEWKMPSPTRSMAPSIAPSIRSNNHAAANEWGATSPTRSMAPSMAPSIRSNNHGAANEWGATSPVRPNSGSMRSNAGSPIYAHAPSIRSNRSNQVFIPGVDMMHEAIGEEPAEGHHAQMMLTEDAVAEAEAEAREKQESAEMLNDLLTGDATGATEPTAASADDWGMPVKEKKGKKGKKGKK
ncbi:hypothetical protein FRB93_003284 [Tulasnella sp. JGI-2019a]|nr:hypothetical protein FRB93_003284 [Tulasnella sp. JGI-2019a]